jgi:hypothetical protein
MAFDTMPEYIEEVRKESEDGEAEIQRIQAVQVRKKSPTNALQTTWGNPDSSKM